MNTFFSFIICLLSISAVNLERLKIWTRPDVVQFSYFPLASNYLEFSLKAEHDAYIVFTNSHDLNSAYYMILLGGWKNTKSVIRKDNYDIRQECNSVILNAKGFQSYWIKLNETISEISVGKLGSEAFLRFKDKDFVRMSQFGLSTGHGAAGEWNFDSKMICKSNCLIL